MKLALNDMVSCLKSTSITKHIDSETKLVCKNCTGEPLSLRINGDFSVNALQILAVLTAVTVSCTCISIAKKLKK